jgi:hypothetical protein
VEAKLQRTWEADPAPLFERRMGPPAKESGNFTGGDECPDIWQLDNGDIAVMGRDLMSHYASGLPEGVALGADERLVIIPGNMLSAAEPGIADV